MLARVLLGSWPSQVAAWGDLALAAYLSELKGRSLTPEAAIYALRTWPDPKWPPSAGDVLAAALVDPGAPTFEEALDAICAHGGILKAHPPHKALITGEDERQAQQEALDRAHPLVASFAVSQGLTRLAHLPLEDPEWGEKYRRDLEAAWLNHRENSDRRQVAVLARGGGLKRLDPLADQRQIEAA